jgi:hypothetical protein
MSTYQPASPLNRANTDVLVVHCGDHRFQACFHDFLNQGLNLNGNYDLLVIPGGPQSLTLAEYLPKFSWSSWRWFRFLVELHDLKRLVLIQHQDCAWYKTLPLHLHHSPEPRQRQEQDLRRVTEALKKDFPELNVELYYAGWDASDRVTVEAIPT